MRALYTDKGIDFLKDAVSLPKMSLHYVLRSNIERGAELYSRCKEAYAMLKEAVVGGQSLVFKHYHEAGMTIIRPHRFKNLRVCKRIIGYGATALHLSVMLREMPCGKEKLVHCQNPECAAPMLKERLKAVPKFEEMPPPPPPPPSSSPHTPQERWSPSPTRQP